MPPRGGWRQEHRDFAEWLWLPDDHDMGGPGRGLRKIKTVTAYALEHGIALRTLYDWQDMDGWPALMAEVAKESFLNLDPEFLKNWAISLLKPNPNDRLVTAWIRYGRPTLMAEQEAGKWSLLPNLVNGSHNSEQVYAHAMRMIRELPFEQREQFLNIMAMAQNEAQADDLEQPAHRPVKRTMMDREPDQAEQLPALPAPVDTPADTTPIQPDTTPRYDPGRGIRKPIRKPKR
jgi:hypothetical protein